LQVYECAVNYEMSQLQSMTKQASQSQG